MPIGSESDRDIIRPKHQMAVPGLGVFIAPKAVRPHVSTPRLHKVPAVGYPETKTSTLPYLATECYALPTLLPSQAGSTVQTRKKEPRFGG